MRVHLDALGWLYVLVGAAGVLSGAALELIALGTAISLPESIGLSARAFHPAVALLILGGAAFLAGGAAMTAVGRALARRQARARRAALVLGCANLILLPFGTALGIYTFWTLLNDEARLEFGRPLRAPV